MNQLTLPFALNSKMLLSNFIGTKNRQIVEFLSNLLTLKTSSVVYIYGEKSSGKTHLLQGCAFAALEKSYSVAYLDFAQTLPSDVLHNLDDNNWICIDNVGFLTPNQQQNLFDIYNHVANTTTKLIISGNVIPAELNLLNDLKTRLSLATPFHLETLSDVSKKHIIEQQINARNLKIESKIYDYLFKHYSRDLSYLLSAINQLDKASLQQKSNITIPLVKQILGV